MPESRGQREETGGRSAAGIDATDPGTPTSAKIAVLERFTLGWPTGHIIEGQVNTFTLNVVKVAITLG
jgi:hypothetical protein